MPKAVAGLYDGVSVSAARLSGPEVVDSHPDFLKNSMQRERFAWRWDTAEKFEMNMRNYWGMISGVDHVVGRIRDKVKQLGFADNTIFIFTGDNGYYMGQRGFAGKWSHHEESLRVPLVVMDPRSNSTQVKSRDEVVLNIDIAPTIVALAGAARTETHQGASLQPLLVGEQVTDWRTDFFCEHLFHIPGRIPKYEGVRGPVWTYARYFEQEPVYEYLHNLSEDPDQLKNYATDESYAQQLQQMRARCDDLMNELGGEFSLEKFPRRKR